MNTPRTVNILFITTLHHNPGDELIRLGQEHLFKQIIPSVNYSYVHKHDPRTLYEHFCQRRRTPHRLLSPLLYQAMRIINGTSSDKLARTDLVVFAGTPFIFRQHTHVLPCTSANAEWVSPTWGRLIHVMRDKPVMNLAAGTSIDDSSRIQDVLSDRRVTSFLHQSLNRTALITARDELTATILSQLGYQVPVLPCTSLWASEGAGIRPQTPEYVAINIMPAGVHTSRGQSLDPHRWEKTIRQVLPQIEKKHRVLLVCHSEDEARTAAQWFPGRPLVCSREGTVLLAAYSKAYFAICNRVHGAAAAASMNRPALAIGGDSRADLVRQFKLPVLDIRTVTPSDILQVCHDFEHDGELISEGLRSLKQHAQYEYLALMLAELHRSHMLAPPQNGGLSLIRANAGDS